MNTIDSQHDPIFDQIKQASQDARVEPSTQLWDRLEGRLDATVKKEKKYFNLFSLGTLRIAASIALILGVGAFVIYQSRPSGLQSASIELEDLHTLQINPSYHTPHVNDATTIPSAIFMSAETPVKAIEEGTSEKKIVVRKEYGLG